MKISITNRNLFLGNYRSVSTNAVHNGMNITDTVEVSANVEGGGGDVTIPLYFLTYKPRVNPANYGNKYIKHEDVVQLDYSKMYFIPIPYPKWVFSKIGIPESHLIDGGDGLFTIRPAYEDKDSFAQRYFAGKVSDSHTVEDYDPVEMMLLADPISSYCDSLSTDSIFQVYNSRTHTYSTYSASSEDPRLCEVMVSSIDFNILNSYEGRKLTHLFLNEKAKVLPEEYDTDNLKLPLIDNLNSYKEVVSACNKVNPSITNVADGMRYAHASMRSSIVRLSSTHSNFVGSNPNYQDGESFMALISRYLPKYKGVELLSYEIPNLHLVGKTVDGNPSVSVNDIDINKNYIFIDSSGVPWISKTSPVYLEEFSRNVHFSLPHIDNYRLLQNIDKVDISS